MFFLSQIFFAYIKNSALDSACFEQFLCHYSDNWIAGHFI